LAQAVECLLHKSKALSSNPGPTKEKRRKESGKSIVESRKEVA
jgi:hypothetical protein